MLRNPELPIVSGIFASWIAKREVDTVNGPSKVGLCEEVVLINRADPKIACFFDREFVLQLCCLISGKARLFRFGVTRKRRLAARIVITFYSLYRRGKPLKTFFAHLSEKPSFSAHQAAESRVLTFWASSSETFGRPVLKCCGRPQLKLVGVQFKTGPKPGGP